MKTNSSVGKELQRLAIYVLCAFSKLFKDTVKLVWEDIKHYLYVLYLYLTFKNLLYYIR